MKICSCCKQVKPFFEFSISRSRKDGLRAYCKICQSIHYKHYRQTKKGKEVIHRLKKRYHFQYPEKRRSRQAVRDAITAGKLARPEILLCRICKKQAQEYHHNSYAPEDKLIVYPLCQKCHQKIHIRNKGTLIPSAGSSSSTEDVGT